MYGREWTTFESVFCQLPCLTAFSVEGFRAAFQKKDTASSGSAPFDAFLDTISRCNPFLEINTTTFYNYHVCLRSPPRFAPGSATAEWRNANAFLRSASQPHTLEATCADANHHNETASQHIRQKDGLSIMNSPYTLPVAVIGLI